MNNDINEKIVHAAPVPPFVRFVASAVPMVFDNSLSYYEALCALWKWMQDNLVNVVNNNATVTEHYIELTNELKEYVEDYFDNLDVQEEINNKLDDMADAGTLQEIIASYIQSNVAWAFDSVSDMQSATNLVNGSYAQTLGYYSIDDGGKSLYYITDSGTADGGKIIALADNLFAHLVVKNEVYVEQFGAKGDGSTDDQDAINRAMQSGAKTVKFIGGKIYAVKGYEIGQPEGSTTGLRETTGIVVPSNTVVDLNFATVKILANARQNYNAFTLSGVENISVKNGTIIGDVDDHTGASGEWGYGISLRIAENVTLENLNISKCWGDGINLNNDGSVGAYYNTNILIKDCICDDNRRQGMSIENGKSIIVEDSQFINTGDTAHTSPASGVDIEPATDSASNIKFVNCSFNGNYNAGILIDGANIQDVCLSRCKLIDNLNNSGSTIFVRKAKDISILSSRISRDSGLATVVLTPSGDVVVKDNEFYNVRLNLYTTQATGLNFYIKGNRFEHPENLVGNYLIESVSNNADISGTVYVDGNTFVVPSTANVSGCMLLSKLHGISMAYITNNKTLGSRVAIVARANSIIHDNYITKTSGNAISMYSAADVVFDVQNNVFQQISYTDNNAGAINNPAACGMVLRNNTYYKHCLDPSIDIASPTYTSSRFLQNETITATVNVVEYNNVINN